MTAAIAFLATREALPGVRDVLGGVLALAGLSCVAFAERHRDAALAADHAGLEYYEPVGGHAVNDDGGELFVSDS